MSRPAARRQEVHDMLGEAIGDVRALDEIKQFMSDHNAVIMALVCLVLAAKVIGNGVGGLTD